MKVATAPAATATSTGWLLKEFSDLRSSLERLDANFTQWESHGNTYPRASVATDIDALALRFDTARTEFTKLLPAQSELNARLQGDALWIARQAGKVDVMSQHTTTFGRGWSRTLDQPIADTIAAIDLLVGAPTA